MKQGTVKYSEEFVTPIGLKKWFGVELQYDMDTEDPPFDKAKSIVAKAAMTSIGNNHLSFDSSIAPGPSPVISVERTSEDQRIADLIGNIFACTELDGDNGLMSYNKLACTNREAQNAFDIMFRKLAIQK